MGGTALYISKSMIVVADKRTPINPILIIGWIMGYVREGFPMDGVVFVRPNTINARLMLGGERKK
jgi:hypothetical protein